MPTTVSPRQAGEQGHDASPSTERDYFCHDLQHTLGYLNSTYGLPDGLAPDRYNVGGPRQPFPWLTWNNRPFANHMELLLVPAASPSRLLLEFTTDTGEDPYRGVDRGHVRAPFGHLLNFFHSSRSQAGGTAEYALPNLYRLLDLVEVPSRFIGTNRWYNPTSFVGNPAELNAAHPMSSFQPPCNKLSRFRDPGRININTIFDIRVWQAIADRLPHGSTSFWRRLTESRRGYPAGEESRFPTEFANPFRGALGADLQFQLLGLDRPDVEATLLRSDPRNSDVPLFAYDSDEPYEDTRRNAYFRYPFLRRLGNIVSTQSNVYAVWITAGFFEVDPQMGRLGQELNQDTGDLKRHRAFYIIDRSIPVAFEPGENHNVDRAVLLRRFIE